MLNAWSNVSQHCVLIVKQTTIFCAILGGVNVSALLCSPVQERYKQPAAESSLN